MTYTLIFKTPDVLDQLNDQIEDPEELRRAKIFISKYLKYNEILKVSFHMSQQTVEVEEV